ncbi:MAG: flagellar brake protein [Nitrospira sp.]
MNDMTVASPSADTFLTVGLPLKLSITLNGSKGMYGSTLLGWKEHAWLVCEWPLQIGHGTEIPRGMPCTVSYLHEGKLIGYRSEIRDVITAPVPLVFVAYPQTVEAMHLRKHARVASSEPVVIERADRESVSTAGLLDHGMLGGLLQDLSLGGCRITLTEPPDWIKPGVRIRLEFELAGLGHVTNLTGIVKSAEANQKSIIAGVEFCFQEMEYIEYRGWGGSVQQAIEQWTSQKLDEPFPH